MKRILFFAGILSLLFVQIALSQDTIVLQPGPEGKDAIINTYIPDEARPDYQLFRSMAWTHSGTPASHRSLIEWDLSFLSPETTILEAKLDLYFATWAPNYEQHTGGNASYLMRITEPWEEQEVTWNNQPAAAWDDAILLPQSTTPDQDYPDIDVTSQVQQMVSDPENNHGLMIRLITEQYYRCMLFASGDYPDPGKRPRLRIIYMGCTVPTVDFDYQATGQSVSFTGISPTAMSWHWDFGDGETSDIQNPEHYYDQQGFYQVCLTVEDTCYHAGHCEEIEICTAAPVAGFTYTLDGLTAFFQDITEFANEYYWDFGDGYFSSLQDPYHIYDSDGEYQVCLIASNSCGSDTSCQWLDLCAPPVSGFDYTIDGSSVYFEDQSERAVQYYWNFGDGYYSNLANPWHVYEDIGNYEVCLTTWNECGTDTLCNILHMSTVSIPENGEGSFVMYPNPARDKAFIKSSFTGPVEIILSDLSGKVVYKEEKDGNTGELIQIGLDGLKPGIYIVRLNSGKSQAFGKMIVMN
jgi:PKD repeat protein